MRQCLEIANSIGEEFYVFYATCALRMRDINISFAVRYRKGTIISEYRGAARQEFLTKSHRHANSKIRCLYLRKVFARVPIRTHIPLGCASCNTLQKQELFSSV